MTLSENLFYKGVIFDFNGTLFFDSDKHILAWDAIAKKVRGNGISEDEVYQKLNGTPNNQNILYLTEGKVTEEEMEELSLLKEQFYREFCEKDPEHFHLVEGAESFFEALKKQGIPFTIASASIKPNIDFFIRSFHLDQWMRPEDIIYDDGTYQNKIAMFQKAAEVIGVPMEEILIVEDSVSGIQSAYRAGCRKILVVCEKEKEAENWKRPGVIGTMQDFTQIGRDM